MDILKVSDEELPLLTGTTDCESGTAQLAQNGIRLIFVTLGANGVFYRFGDKTGHVAGVPCKVGDTNGAGDTFFGAALSKLCKEELDTLTVKDASGSKIKVKDKGDGKFTFTMPASKVTVSAEFAEIETLDFADVSTDAYYYEAVKWAAKKGITGGIGNGLFGPNQPCTRAQIVTFLWRAAGSPEPKAMSSFADVSTDAYYAKAVAWAVENGITTGTGDGKFSPDATCTRAQSVTFLFRAIGKLVDSKAEFSDVLTDSYYANAVAWAVENGVTNGIGDGLFGPDNSCTRAQIVTFLYRAYQGK